jgi:CelD/BcsL family acetyltransferase involved in cellulose biosynthesis
MPWRNLQASNPTLGSPFFSPEFTEIVARVCGQVEVAVWKTGGEVVALFPYERKTGDFAGPVGRHISDYDGLIARPDFVRDPSQILRECGLVAWDFQHSLASDPIFGPLHKAKSYVALTDMRCGYDEYIKKHKATDHRQLKNYFKRMQKLEEEIGPLNFVLHSGDEALLQKLMELKSAQCQRNGWRDVFVEPWTAEVLRAIHRNQSPEFAGMLSALYAGPHLIALHFGMRSTKVLHRWFPVHEESYSKYSPGIMLNLKMLAKCPDIGIATIDWGAGEHQLKQFVMDSSVSIGSGSAELPSAATLARRFRDFPSQARQRIGKSCVGGVARRLRDWVQSK